MGGYKYDYAAQFKAHSGYVTVAKDGSAPKTLTPDADYTVGNGSLLVTLTDSYLKTLEPGEYTLIVHFASGADDNETNTAVSHFSIPKPSGSDSGSTNGIPSTGGLLLIVQLWSVLLLSLGYALTFFSKGFKPALADGISADDFADEIYADAQLDAEEASVELFSGVSDGGLEENYSDEFEDADFDEDFDEYNPTETQVWIFLMFPTFPLLSPV